MQKKIFFFLPLFFMLLACENESDCNYEKIAIEYLKKRGYSDFIRLNDMIPEIQFVAQRRINDIDNSDIVNSFDRSEFYECSQNQLCYNTFIDGNRVKSLYFSATLKKSGKGKRFSVGVFIDTVYLNPIGIINGAPRQALSISKYDNSEYSTKKEISESNRLAFNDSLRKVDDLKINEIKKDLKKATTICERGLCSHTNLDDVFYKDYIHHIALLSLIQDYFISEIKHQKDFVNFERKDNVIYMYFDNKKICMTPFQIKECD